MRKNASLIKRLMSPLVRGRRFARDEDGAVAVEFGLLALPFFTLIYAILETALVFFAGQVFDSALQDASRKIRTGQAQTASDETPAWDLNRFRQEICSGLYGLFDCSSGADSRMLIRVTIVDAFSGAQVVNPVGDACLLGDEVEEDEEEEEEGDPCGWAVEEAFVPGVGSQIVIVQAFYKWPTIINMPGFNLATQVGGNRLLTAARVFRNEPF